MADRPRRFPSLGRCGVTTRSGHRICVALAQLTGASIIAGNQMRLLRDGTTYFPALLSAIENARRSVSLQMYRFHGGAIATRFVHALADRARAGVHVRILIDDYGTGGMDRKLAGLLAASGVDVRVYNPLRITNLWRMNQRNHRKLLAVDGGEAFLGGMNIDDVFAGDGARRAWRENAVHIRGALAREIDARVIAAWSGEESCGASSITCLEAANESDAQLLLSGPESPILRAAYLHVIRNAQRSIYVSSAYFVPPVDLADALAQAARNGVDVRVLTAGTHNNIPLARTVSHATYDPLLRDGVRIFEYRPTMLHAKTIIVDGQWCALGSANFDACGLRFNLESQIATCDEALVDGLRQSYLADAADADEITFAAWSRRPFSVRLRDVLLQPLRRVV